MTRPSKETITKVVQLMYLKSIDDPAVTRVEDPHSSSPRPTIRS